MTNHDRYGTLAQPEERTRIEVVEDPVQVVRGAYAVWRRILKKDEHHNYYMDDETLEQCYAEAVRLLQPYGGMFGNLKRGDLEAIIMQVDRHRAAGNWQIAGAFLSALLNTTRLPKLDGEFRCSRLGYRLAPGKTLIVRKASSTSDIGHHAQGGLIVNYNEAGGFAEDAAGGIHVNYGSVHLMGRYAAGGIHLNFGTCDRLAEDAGNCISVNYAEITPIQYGHPGTYCNEIARAAQGGVHANYGDTPRCAARAQGGVHINGGYSHRLNCKGDGGAIFNRGEVGYKGGRWMDYKPRRRQLAEPLVARLDWRLRRLKHFARLKNKPDEAAAALSRYDWKAFETSVHGLAKQIEEVFNG
jgi:hypothetical protein